MKKILLILLALILLATGGLFYQRYRASKTLAEVASAAGKTFKSYGLKLTLPPNQAKIEGWLQPSLRLNQIELGFSPESSISIPNATLKASLTNSEEFEISVPKLGPYSKGHETLNFDQVTLLIHKDGTLRGAKATKILLTSDQPEYLHSVATLIEPAFEIGDQTTFIPSRLSFVIRGIDFSEKRKKHDWSENPEDTPKELKFSFTTAQLKEIKLELTSQKSGENRDYTVVFEGQGGEKKDLQKENDPAPPEHTVIKPWKVKSSGSSKEISYSDAFGEIVKIKNGIVELTSRSHSLPSESNPSNPFEAEMNKAKNIFQEVLAFLKRVDLKDKGSEINWEGLETHGKEGSHTLVGKLHGASSSESNEHQMKGSGEIILDQFTSNENNGTLNIKNLKLNFHGTYQIGMNDFFKLYFEMLFSRIPFVGNKSLIQTALQTLSIYPDDTGYELSAETLDFKSLNENIQLKNPVFGFKADANGAEVYLKGLFQHYEDLKNPMIKFDGAQTGVSLGFVYPHQELLKLARQTEGVSDEELLQKLSRIFSGKQSGAQIKFEQDMGANGWKGILEARMLTDFGKALDLSPAESRPETQSESLSYPDVARISLDHMEKVRKKLAEAILKPDNFKISLNLMPLEKFKNQISGFFPGAGLFLQQINPYAVINSKEDKLTIDIEYKDGKILLNGQSNSEIDKIYQGLNGKLSSAEDLPSKAEDPKEGPTEKTSKRTFH